METLIIIAGLVAVMAVIFGLVGFLATLRGFQFWSWFFSGLLGMIVVVFLPSAKSPGISDIEQGIRANRGNSVGKWVSIFYMAILAFRVLAQSEIPEPGVADYRNPDTAEIRSE